MNHLSRTRRSLALLLAASALLLGVMVPGGPLETRRFAQYPPVVLATFNIFLTVLGLGSLVLVPLVVRRSRRAAQLGVGAGLGYLAVYVADLAGVFPQSVDAMSAALWLAELAGAALSLPLIALGWRLSSREPSAPQRAFGLAWIATLALLVLAGLGIVAFATRAAME